MVWVCKGLAAKLVRSHVTVGTRTLLWSGGRHFDHLYVCSQAVIKFITKLNNWLHISFFCCNPWKLTNHVFVVAGFAMEASSSLVIYFKLSLNFFPYPIFVMGKRIWTLNIQSVFICLPEMNGWLGYDLLTQEPNKKHWRKCPR